MAIHAIIEAMQDLSAIHQELIAISDEKTNAVIEGDMNALQQTILKERKLVQKLEQAEKKRTDLTSRHAKERGLQDESVTAILEDLENREEQNAFEAAAVELAGLLADLRYKEQSNHELLQQSMQFVQYSLNLMNPSINKMNYGTKKPDKQGHLSVFDSRA